MLAVLCGPGDFRVVEKDQARIRSFGRKVRLMRLERELSQEDLAGLSGMTRNHIGAIERGTKTASLTAIFHLADALGVAPSMLFETPGRV
jgi:transcriptional regulator with XRE-family HTH domain